MKKIQDALDGKTVLVTGGAGAIGSNLVRELIGLETKNIIIVDDLSSSYEWNIPRSPKVHFMRSSILDDEGLKRAFKEKPQIVYHLAAHFANQNSVDNPEIDLSVNGLGTLKILEYSRLVDV
jgi:UDP-glucose 4-epimerase